LKIPKGGNQNPYIEEEQTTQWPKEKVQKYKHRSTKHTYKTKDRLTRTKVSERVEYLINTVIFSQNTSNLAQALLTGYDYVAWISQHGLGYHSRALDITTGPLISQ
jgi:hypothetical protein